MSIENEDYEHQFLHKNYENLSVEEICQLIDLTADTMDNYLYVYDFEHDYYYIAPRAVERFRLPAAGFYHVMDSHAQLVYPEDQEALNREMDELMHTNRTVHDMQYRWMSREGKPVWINCRGTVVRDETGKAVYMTGCINEIGRPRKADNESGMLKDTGLVQYLQEHKEHSDQGYFLRIGVDGLKSINGRLGMAFGDMILCRLADCIKACVKPEQQIFRTDSDEYLIVSPYGKREDAIRMYHGVRHQVDAFLREIHYEVIFTISSGILLNEDFENHSYDNILKLTEYALYCAKCYGKNTYAVYDKKSYHAYLSRQELLMEIVQSVNNDFAGFHAFYQPIFHRNGGLYGLETLMRYVSETRGMVSPAELIPLLEESSLIVPVGNWIMDQALKMGREFQKHQPGLKIGLNVSYVQIMKSDFVGTLIETIEKYGIKPSTVTIELTESGLLESEPRLKDIWNKLKNYGVRLALDDFGTGYSNFHYLNELRPNTLKVDRSFMVSAMGDSYEFALLKNLMALAHNLGLEVCMEGIETEEEESKMGSIEPEFFQGFKFGRPCPAEDFHCKYLTA
jgi:diguanylate cyclase (GGDEF)-like protein